MNRVLITGGAGFIGSNLVASLHGKGYDITVLDSFSEQIHGTNWESSPLFRAVDGKARIVRGSVCDRDLMEKVLDGPDFLVHLAAETGTGQSMYMIDHYTRVNIQATAMMLDILSARKARTIKRMVVASSRAIYGEGKYLDRNGVAVYPDNRNAEDLRQGRFDLYGAECGEPLTVVATDEDSRIHPSSVYGITKQVQEQLVMTICPLIGIEPVALRYQNVYGPGQSLSNPYTGILSIFSNRILQGGSINLFEDGLESRDFVFIDDVVDATVQAMEHQAAPGHVFNVGSGVQTSVRAVVDSLLKAYAAETKVEVTGDYRMGDIRHNFADLRRISAILGYAPRVSFAEGIQRFAQWVTSQGAKRSAYDDSLAEMKQRGLFRSAGA
jgi:dTDP-L-rhamnose 4-epimerase